MKDPGERIGRYNPDGMFMFQMNRRTELMNKKGEPPATSIRFVDQTVNGKWVRRVFYLDPRSQRSLAEIPEEIR